jgi:hypothetical protein
MGLLAIAHTRGDTRPPDVSCACVWSREAETTVDMPLIPLEKETSELDSGEQRL